MRRVIKKPTVIAGLKWPPEMCPSAETITAMASPCAIAMPISEGSWMALAVTIEPAPMKISVNVPTNSATPRRSASSNMRGTYDPARTDRDRRPRQPPARPGAPPDGLLATAGRAGGSLPVRRWRRGRCSLIAAGARRAHTLRLMRRRVTFSRNLTLSLSRTCRCYCKYCAFATHGAHLYAPDEVLRILDGAARRNVKELLVLTGERPEHNAEVAARLHEHGHEEFTSYVVWTCERALERGHLPHT